MTGNREPKWKSRANPSGCATLALKSGRFRTAGIEAAGFATRVPSELPVKIFVSCFLLSTAVWAQDPMQVHGYIQGRFTNQEGTPDRLEIRRARLILSGDPISKLSYTFQVDFVKQPYLMDAALTWKFSRALRLTGGQFKIPFSAESLVSDNLNMPIARARAVNGLSPGRDTGVQGRDVGVQLAGTLHWGNGPLIDYAAGVFRGQTFVDAP